MASINIKKKDYIWSYLGTFVKLGVNILLLPIVLLYLTDEELGLWYVYGSIGALVALLDFGFAPALARNISYVWCGATSLKKEDVTLVAKNKIDYAYFKTLLYTCKVIYWVVALISLLLLLGPGSYYIIHVASTEYIASWIIYSLSMFIGVLYGYYTSFLRGIGAIAESNIASVYSKLIQVVLSIAFLLLGYGLMGYAVASLISCIVVRFYSYSVFNKYDDIGVKIKNVRIENVFLKVKSLFFIVWHNASKDGLVTLSNYLSTQANTLICSSVIGLASTGSYGLSVQFAAIISTLAYVPYSTNHSKLQEMSVSGNKQEGIRIFASAMGMFVLTFFVLSICLLLCIPIIKIFKPTYDVNIWMLIMILFYMFIYNYYNLFCSYISTFNKLPYTKSYILTAVFSIMCSFVFSNYFNMGVWALIICPLIISLAYNAWVWPLYVVHDLLKMSLRDFYTIGLCENIYILKKYIRL